MEIPERVIAIDWSGAKSKSEQKKKIWSAEVDQGGLRALQHERTRGEVCEDLLDRFNRNSKVVIGLDFSFSFPAWFLQERKCDGAKSFWEYAEENEDAWLNQKKWSKELPPTPFFKKNEQWPWSDHEEKKYRATETALRDRGLRPESVFRLTGQKQVGPGSIRGFPILRKLKEKGFHIWPFDPPELPLVVEIYPRLFYGKEFTKSNVKIRLEYLKKHYPNLEELDRAHATCSDDAFDALVSAFTMFTQRERFGRLQEVNDIAKRYEGWIWC